MGLRIIKQKSLAIEYPRRRVRERLVSLPRLIRNATEKEQQLPATMIQAWVFGSVLRGESFVGDLDITLVYEMNAIQRYSWAQFENLIRYPFMGDDDDVKEVNKFVRKTLFKYEDYGYLSDALGRQEVISMAEVVGLNMNWARCFSWTELRGGSYGMFLPRVEKVLRKEIVGVLATQGFQVHFSEKQNASTTPPGIWAPNPEKKYRLIWSRPESPENSVERLSHLDLKVVKDDIAEFATEIANEDIPELQEKVKNIREKAAEKGIKLELDGSIPSVADSLHISHHDDQGLRELSRLLRDQLDTDKKVNAILNTVSWILEERSPTTKVELARELLERYPNRIVREDECRIIMQQIGLPEDEIVFYGKGKWKWVLHEPSSAKRSKILVQSALRNEAHRVELKIRKLLPSPRKWDTSLSLQDDGRRIATKDAPREIRTKSTTGVFYMGRWFRKDELHNLRPALLDVGWELDDRWSGDTIHEYASRQLNFDIRGDLNEIKKSVLVVLAPFIRSNASLFSH